MTQEQEKRLIEAFNNVEDLLGEEDAAQLVEQVVALFNGKAGELSEKPMGRKKKSETKYSDALSAPTPTSIAVPEDRDKLITEWKATADQLAELKAKEHALRQALVAQCFDGTKLEGTETVDIGWGYQLRVSRELCYNATDKNGETKALIDALVIRDTGLAADLIRWKPDVAVRAYRQVQALAQQHNDSLILELLHKAITLKPGMPQLELVPPKQGEPAAPVATVQPPVYVVEENFSPE